MSGARIVMAFVNKIEPLSHIVASLEKEANQALMRTRQVGGSCNE